MSADGTIVAGAAGVLRGSLFVPLGGQYYLKVTDGTIPPPAQPTPPPTPTALPTNSPPNGNTNAAPLPSTNAPTSPETNAAPSPAALTNAAVTNTPPFADTNAPPIVDTTNAPPATPPPPVSDSPPITPEVSWHLQVVQLSPSVSADEAITVYTPYFIVPDSAVSPAAAPTVLPLPVLTDEQAKTIVTIKGDCRQGIGFLMRSPSGTFVVTHLHLLEGNPHITLTTSSGAVITPTALKGAFDRDLAEFSIQDNQFTYLPAPTDAPDSVQAGDQIIIPDVAEHTDILQGRPGTIVGTNAERIDFDVRMRRTNVGSPIIHVKSGTVIGLFTAQKRVDVTQRLAMAWPGNPAPDAASIIPFYGLRVGGVTKWETYDPARFLQETTFLQRFHDTTHSLDAFLNGRQHHYYGMGQDQVTDDKFYQNCVKLRSALDNFHQLANGADDRQRLDADRELLFDLDNITDTDLTALRGMSGLYGYDQTWAQEEIAYRLALKAELKEMHNNLSHFDIIARSR
jgi:hypothetical protein